jgi:hypothetical protein
MKKVIALFLSAIFLISCNENTGTGKKQDNSSIGADTSQHGDTSSYERMPNKTSDTSQH